MRALLLFLLLLASAIPAFAQSSPDLADEADLHFQLGVEAYRRGDFDDALDHLFASNRLAPNKNVVYNIARAYEQLHRYPEAFRWYSDYLDQETDTQRRAGAEQALAGLRQRVALVRVTSDPPGASIYVDRKDLGVRGRTPRVLALEPGAHRIYLERDGHDPAWSPNVQLVVGGEASVHLPLAMVLGEVQLVGSPAGAEVRVDDDRAPVEAALPATLRLPPGPHVLVVSAAGHETVRQLVQVEARAAVQAQVDLPLVTGTLVVDAAERDALIEIDGQAAGFTPAVVPVPVGAHSVRVTLAGYRPYEAFVQIGPKATTTVSAPLRPMQEVTAASRTTQDVEDAPASVSLVTAEELRVFGSQTLYDALGAVRGVFPSSDRSYESLGFRGFARPGDYGNRVLVTLDGHALNDDLLGASYVGHDLLPDLMDLERIEVVRGPGSALYGSNAFFGVVNLVTRSGESTRPPHVSLAGDGTGAFRARAGASGRLGTDGGWWASAGGVTSQGDDIDLGAAGVSTDADDMTSAGLRGRLWAGDWQVEAYGNWRDKQIPTGAFETILGDERSRTEDGRGFVEVRYEPTLSPDVRLFSRVWADHYRFRGSYPYDDAELGVLRDTWDGTWAGAEARVVAQATPWLRMTAGLEGDAHLAAHLTGSDVAGTYLDASPGFQVVAAYAEGELSPADAVSATVGARADVYSTFGAALSPRVAVLLRPSEAHTLKLLGGRAFRAPSVYELTYNDDGVTQIAAPELQPEEIWTGEAEWSTRASEVVIVTGSVFYNRMIGLVNLEETESGALQYQNVAEPVQAAGAEAEVRRDWRKGWMLAANVSGQRVRTGTLADGDELTNSPAALFGLRAAAPIVAGAVTGATRVRVESGRLASDGERTDPMLLWDLVLTGRVPSLGLEWGAGLKNLLDADVAWPAGEDLPVAAVPQPGRTVYAEATVTF